MSRKKTILLALFLVPSIFSGAVIWGYNNYLYDLDASCPPSMIAGSSILGDIEVASNTGAVVHVELKGAYSWGDWIYDSEILNIPLESQT